MELSLRASEDGNSLEVKNFIAHHNHERKKVIGKEICFTCFFTTVNIQGLFDMLPHQRKLSKEETMEVERLLSLKANKKMVKDKLEQMSGKIVTLKDISNISTKQGHKNTRNDLTETVRKLTERYGTLITFCLDGRLMVFVKYIIYLHLLYTVVQYNIVLFAV